MTAALLNHTECIEMYWMMKNLGPSKFLNRVTEGGTKQFRLSLKLVVLQEIRSPIFNLKKNEKHEKGTPDWKRMHWYLINDEEFWFLKLSKLK